MILHDTEDKKKEKTSKEPSVPLGSKSDNIVGIQNTPLWPFKDTSSLLEKVFVGLSEVCVCLKFNLLYFFFFFFLATKLIDQVSGCEFFKNVKSSP